MKTKIALSAAAAALVLAGCATIGSGETGQQTTRRYVLADNSVLLVDPDGRMRMFDIYQQPIYMKDGVAMTTKDNEVIVMKENVIWKSVRTKGTVGPRGG